jgi:hypothetical protein
MAPEMMGRNLPKETFAALLPVVVLCSGKLNNDR